MTKRIEKWRQYQDEVAAFFREQGCNAEVEAKVDGVRTTYSIDVLVTFVRFGLECKWLIECKYWNTRIPQEKIETLKSIVKEVGADRGIVISEKGFQTGASKAARKSNITLITSLEDFKRTAKTDLIATRLIKSKRALTKLATIYEFPQENEPKSLLFDGQTLFVGNWQGNNIAFVDPKGKSVLDIIELDNYEAPVKGKREIRRYPPGNLTIADGKLFVGQVFSEFILVIDVETRAIVKRLSVPGGGEGAITSSPDGRWVYFASNLIPQFYIIDTATYDIQTMAYPSGGRGCLAIAADEEYLFIGIQRGGNFQGKTYSGGNSFLAVYNLRNNKYEATTFLADIIDGRSDNSSPVCITLDPDKNLIYVGMFQSTKGICCIDRATLQIIQNIEFRPNSINKYFSWVDPLAQAVYGDYLLSVNRNNCELVILDRETLLIRKSIPLGEAPNGPDSLVVIGEEAIISYPSFKCIIFVDLHTALKQKIKS